MGVIYRVSSLASMVLWPYAGNTGIPAGTVLTPHTGDITITVDNTVLDAMDITGGIIVNANNVLIKRCRVTTGDFYGISMSGNGHSTGGSGTTVQDCYVFMGGATGSQGNFGVFPGAAGSGSTDTVLRCDISGAAHGIQVGSNNVLIQDNYIHDLNNSDVAAHYDGIGVQGGNSNINIQHNSIWGRDTSCVFIDNDFGAVDNVTVNNCLLTSNGFDLYSNPVYADTKSTPAVTITNVRVTNCLITAGSSGYLASQPGTTVVWTNNRDPITGALVGP